jgi:hypothetical protein
MWCPVFRVIGQAVDAFITELSSDSKDFESSESVSLVITPHLTQYVTVLLIDPYNEGCVNYEVNIVMLWL